MLKNSVRLSKDGHSFVSMGAEILSKRNGWLRYACSKLLLVLKLCMKELSEEKPARTIRSEILGYALTSAYVKAHPKRCLVFYINNSLLSEAHGHSRSYTQYASLQENSE